MKINATQITHAQGSEAWMQHRAKSCNASDLAVVMGLSPYKTREQYIAERATGITAEIDAATQRRFDRGHEYEAIARGWAEEILGTELYPVVLAAEVEGLILSASLDGLPVIEDPTWEHKSGNAALLASLEAGVIPDQYHPQLEQGLMLSGATRCMFMASSGDRESMRFAWYESNPELRARIIPTWKQVQADIAAYVPIEVLDKPAPVGHSPDQLPALRSSVKGELVLESNIKEWEAAALAYIQTVRDHELVTDEDFANADAAAKWCDSSKTTLQGVKSALMNATGDVNTAVGTIDRIMAELDKTRIAFNNAGKARKEARKAEIVAGGVAGLRDHIAALNARLGKPYMPAIAADFGAAIRGKSNLAKMQDAVNTELANAKIRANEAADRIDLNLKHLQDKAGAHKFLFLDTPTIVLKAPDDLQALVANRINAHELAEQKKQDELREKIRKEEADRLQREADERAAEAKRIADAAEAQRLADEAQAKQRTDALIEAVATPAPAPAPVAAPATGVQMQAVASDTITGDGSGTALSGMPRQAYTPPRVSPALPSDSGARLTLGQINERIAPLSITVAGLSELGFDPVEQVKASRFYRESDLGAICEALIQHLTTVADGVVA